METSRASSLLRRLRHAPDEETFAREFLSFLCRRFVSPCAMWRCAPPRRTAWLFVDRGKRLQRLSPEEVGALDAVRPGEQGVLLRENGVVVGEAEIRTSLDVVVPGILGDEWFGVGNPPKETSATDAQGFEEIALAATTALDALQGRLVVEKTILGGHLLRTPLWTLELALEEAATVPEGPGKASRSGSRFPEETGSRITAALALLQGGIDILALPDLNALGSVLLTCGDVGRRIQTLGEAWAFLEKREWAFSAGRFSPKCRMSQGATLLLTLMLQYLYGERGARAVACILRPLGAEVECVLEGASFEGPPGVLAREVRRLLDMFALSWQESASTGGLLWKIRLPLVLGTRRKDVVRRTTPPRVLVVDDNATNRQIIADVLRGIGCRVDTAEDGLDALRAVADREPDVIFMDILMPHMDGAGATKELRRRGVAVPIIALTAGGAGTALEALESGMDDYALKPVSRLLLGDLLAQWTGYDGFPAVGEGDAVSLEETFAVELPLIRSALRRAWLSGNRDEARILAERLESSAAQCGRDDLSRTARALEEALSEGQGIDALLAQLFDRTDVAGAQGTGAALSGAIESLGRKAP